MNSPCGHKNAVCVIGNYWQCKECANETKVFKGKDAIITFKLGDLTVRFDESVPVDSFYIEKTKEEK